MFRWDGPLGHRIDDLRAQALDALDGALEEAGLNQQPQIGQQRASAATVEAVDVLSPGEALGQVERSTR